MNPRCLRGLKPKNSVMNERALRHVTALAQEGQVCAPTGEPVTLTRADLTVLRQLAQAMDAEANWVEITRSALRSATGLALGTIKSSLSKLVRLQVLTRQEHKTVLQVQLANRYSFTRLEPQPLSLEAQLRKTRDHNQDNKVLTLRTRARLRESRE
jgi:hypothetical protein